MTHTAAQCVHLWGNVNNMSACVTAVFPSPVPPPRTPPQPTYDSLM